MIASVLVRRTGGEGREASPPAEAGRWVLDRPTPRSSPRTCSGVHSRSWRFACGPVDAGMNPAWRWWGGG